MPLKEFSADDGHAIADTPDTGSGELFAMLPLNLVVTSRTNPRRTLNQAKLVELADSISASGVHQAILVRPLPAARMADTFQDRRPGEPLPTYEIVSGERRYRASVLAEVATIPAMIRSLTDDQALEIQIIENLQREDLSELEEAEGYQRLCETTGLQKEAIGERIGKSRAYVYARLKLLDLTSGPREALRNGDIDASKALLIARIPDEKLQVKALAAAVEKDHQGSPRLSYRALQTWVQQNVMLKLDAARFAITAVDLVPAAGACGDCGKRTGANPDLFADVDSPDVCTDPVCFHAKEAAHTAVLVAQARAKGMEVIEGREAMELQPYSHGQIKGYTSLDEEGYGNKPLRDELTAKEIKSKVLFVDPHNGVLVEVVPDEVAGAAYARSRQAARTPTERKVDKQRKEERERYELEIHYHGRWRQAAVDAIAPRIKAGEIRSMSPNMMRAMVLELSGYEQYCDEECVADALGMSDYDEDGVTSAVRSTDDNEVGFLLILTLLNGNRIPRHNWSNGVRTVVATAPVIEELASLLGIDLEAIKAGVQAEIRAERAPQEPTASEQAAPQGEETKGKKGKPAARAKPAKTTPAEASKSIADALQALDAEPAGAGLGDGMRPTDAWPFPKTGRP